MVEKKPVITSVQLALMAVGCALVFPFTFMPILSIPSFNQDVWVVLLVSFVYMFILSIPLLFLMNKFRGMSIHEMSELALGNVFGKVALVIVALFCLSCFTSCILFTVTSMALYIIPDTPIWAMVIFTIIPVTYAAYKGAGTIGRLSFFIVPIVILTTILFFIAGIPDMDFTILQPVLAESTFLQINKGAFITAARYSEIIVFWIFSYFLVRKSSINKTYAFSHLTYLLVFLLMLISTITVLGIEYASRVNDPYFTFTRQIKIFSFLERLQSINLMAWFPCTMLNLSIYNYMASYIFAGFFKTKTHKHFVIPVSAAAFIVCMLPVMTSPSTMALLHSHKIYPYVTLSAIFVVPAIISIAYLLRRKKIDQIISNRRKEISVSSE